MVDYTKLAVAIQRLQNASTRAYALVASEAKQADGLGEAAMLVRLLDATRDIDNIASGLICR